MRSRCPRLDIDFDCAYRLDISRLCSRSKDPSAVSCCRFGRKLLATGDVNGTILSNGTCNVMGITEPICVGCTYGLCNSHDVTVPLQLGGS